MKKIIFIIGCFLLGVEGCLASTKNVSFSRCVDGDTAVFILDGEEVKFRFLAIDTPETVHPTKQVEAYGKNASEYTCNKLSNAKEIIVEYEEKNKTDKYGRSLGWIWVDGNLIQKELIEIGYAKVAYIYGNYKYTKSLCLLQNKAYVQKLGIWNDNDDQGYCSTVDLTDVEENIDYNNMEIETSELEKNLKKAVDKAEKITNYVDKNDEKISNTLFYVMVGVAAIYLVIKNRK